MARVFTKKKSRAGKSIKCETCGTTIAPLTTYRYFWKRISMSKKVRGVRHIRCMAPGCKPMPSDLSSSKIAAAYDAQEILNKEIDGALTSQDCSDLHTALTACAEAAEQVKDEYQEGLDNMPEQLQNGDTGTGMQEKIEALESWHDALETAAGEIESRWDSERIEDENAGPCNTDLVNELCSEAQTACDELSV